jgi:hypothetical protein
MLKRSWRVQSTMQASSKILSRRFGREPVSDRHLQLRPRPWRPPQLAASFISNQALGCPVWTGRALQAGFEQMEGGLAPLYPALAWSVCAPGHHGYPRASDLILRKALRGR